MAASLTVTEGLRSEVVHGITGPLPGVVTSEYHHCFHTDLETPETVSWTGLEASTRAYARIID